MTYKESLEYLYGLQKYGVKFGLSKTSNLMKRLGNPHKGRAYIHIAGTNGKGSVAATLQAVLAESGLKVGFYSSPHLVRFTERFRINGKEISKKDTVRLVEEIKSVISPEEPPTYFEVTTAMGLVYFAREETDITILEVGMGGRLDATNIVKPLVTAITNISLEHQAFLGKRLVDIAGEKAGIVKKGVDMVTAVTQPSVIKRVEEICTEKGAPLWRVGRDIKYRASETGFNYYGIDHMYKNLETSLRGDFQKKNTSQALAVLELLSRKGYSISEENIRKGLSKTVWPGRVHMISENPYIVLDGAHNPGAITELVRAVQNGFSYKRLILVMGIMKDKSIDTIINGLCPIASHVICTSPVYFRSATAEDLHTAVKGHAETSEAIPSVEKAIEKARQIAAPEDLILITGSLFTVGEALTALDPVKYHSDGV